MCNIFKLLVDIPFFSISMKLLMVNGSVVRVTGESVHSHLIVRAMNYSVATLVYIYIYIHIYTYILTIKTRFIFIYIYSRLCLIGSLFNRVSRLIGSLLTGPE